MTGVRQWSVVLFAALLAVQGLARAEPNVAAASDLKFALEEVAAAFSAQTGDRVALTFGSSGNLYRQILQGAPFELFLSADETFVHRLVEAGIARDAGVLYAIGRIVLIVPQGAPLDVQNGLDGLRAALGAGAVRRFAIANPEHAPYGRAAEQALRQAGLWETVQPRLVLGENVSQAAQFVLSGSADGGIVAYSLVRAPVVDAQSRWVLLPAETHAPLRQRMVLTRSAGPVATALYGFLQTPRGRAILERYGFTVPESGP